MTDDDGLRGPVGDQFRMALIEAGQRLELDLQGLDRVTSFIGSLEWIDQPWHGRALTVRAATYGVDGVTTGQRWILVRIRTTIRLGIWADPMMRSNSPLEGVGLPVTAEPVGPRGTWADEPSLSEDLWTYAAQLPEGAAVLQVRNDAVLWQLRASALDGERLTDAIRLLERVADYAETHDAALSERLGRADGVTGWRRFETAFVLFVIGSIVAIIAAMFIVAAIW